MPRFVAPMDAVWLWIESSNSPKHVVVLQVFTPPPAAGPGLLDDLYAAITDSAEVKPGFRRRAYRSAATGGQFAWSVDDPIDLTAHVRRHTLPAPGGPDELRAYVGQLHTGLLDRARPQWAARLVDGLSDGRFALCTLLHHSLFDGVNMGRHVVGGLSTDPAATDGAPPWLRTAKRPGGPPPVAEPAAAGLSSVVPAARKVVDTAGEVFGSLKALARCGAATVRERELPFAAPDSMFNVQVSRRRRFEGGSWPLARFKDVARRTGTSINDVSLSVTGAALRGYLIEQDALPGRSLVGGVPVATTGTAADAAGRDDNSFAAVLCNLGTDLDDPAERLRRVHASMANSKSLMADIDPLTAAAFTAANIGGFLVAAVPAVPRLPRPAFNLVVSNVPGPREPLYWNGCELTGFYPSSVAMHGQALNVTLLSYTDRITVGLTACPEAVPHLDRLLVHLENGLVDLEKATA